MSTFKLILWLTAAVCVGAITPWTYDFIKSGGFNLVWALAVPCEIKNTCQEGER